MINNRIKPVILILLGSFFIIFATGLAAYLNKFDHIIHKSGKLQPETADSVKTGEISFTSVTGQCDECAGLVGMESAQQNNPPPLTTDAWTLYSGDVLTVNEVWGSKVDPVALYMSEHNLGLFYNSVPGRDWTEGATSQTGSLSATHNLIDWTDYPANPVLNEPQPWQWRNRTSPQGLLHDGEKFVTYYGDWVPWRNENYPGIRAIGVAYSSDMKNWDYKQDEPVLTINDFLREAPELKESSHREYIAGGRVYAEGATYYQGEYYIIVSGSVIPGSNPRYRRIMLKSSNPEGPFKRVHIKPGDRVPSTMPLNYGGKWYELFNMRAPGDPDNRAIGVSIADSIDGPYFNNPENPIIIINHWSSAGNAQLFQYRGRWAVVFSVRYDDERRNLRIAVTNQRY